MSKPCTTVMFEHLLALLGPWIGEYIGVSTIMYQLRQASRLLANHDNRTGQQTEEHATEIAVPKDFANMLLADGA